MEENEISSKNDEIELFLINEENKLDTNKKKHTQNIPTNINSNNNNLSKSLNSMIIDSNSPLRKSPNRTFGLRLYINPSICFQFCKTTKLGKSFALLYNENDDPFIIIGPQWPYCVILLSISTLIYICIFLYYKSRLSLFIKISDWIIFLLWVFSYVFMCMKNPGFPKMNSESIRGTKDMSYCEKCEVWYKPSSSTIHCEICDICIEGYTQHCILSGHCIGVNNKFNFYVFLVFSMIFPIYLMANIIFIGKN